MLDLLAKIYDEAGSLVGARYALFNGDPGFITAVELRFEKMSSVFRANPDDDTLEVRIGSLSLDDSETALDVTDLDLWAQYCGQNLSWAWQLTNQQGYSDGVRLEFNTSAKQTAAIVELVVVASAIQLFIAAAAGAQQSVQPDRREDAAPG
jgi:hypothetical protein